MMTSEELKVLTQRLPMIKVRTEQIYKVICGLERKQCPSGKIADLSFNENTVDFCFIYNNERTSYYSLPIKYLSMSMDDIVDEVTSKPRPRPDISALVRRSNPHDDVYYGKSDAKVTL